MDSTSKSQPRHLAFRAHHRHVVTCLLIVQNQIITASDDKTISIFDITTGAYVRTLAGHNGGVWNLKCVSNTLVSGSTDKTVKIWNLETGKCTHTFRGHTSTVRCVELLTSASRDEIDISGALPQDDLIITGSRDSTLRVWKLPRPGDEEFHQEEPALDEDNKFAVRTLAGHRNSIRAIATFGDVVVSGSYDCEVWVWQVSTGEVMHRCVGHTQKVYSVVLDHERGRCISGSMDNTIKVWSTETGSCLMSLLGHSSLVGLLDLSNKYLVSGAADSTLRVWNPETGSCLHELKARTGAITCFQHDDQKIVSGSDRTAKMWDMESGKCTGDILTELSGVWQICFDKSRCVAAVQRSNLTYIEVLDLTAVGRGEQCRRVFVNEKGDEIEDERFL